MKKNSFKGAVALLTVLFISSILMVGGMVLVFTTVDLGKNISNRVNYTISSQNLQICKEEILLRLKNTPTLTGSFQLIFSNVTCNVVIENEPPGENIKILDIESNYLEFFKKMSFRIDTSVKPFIVTTI